MTKSLPISKRTVYESYLKVTAKGGSAGIDKETIELFNYELSDNLYKLWNRMTSGSYFPPPVQTVFIPKKSGGVRPLGIPTVSDRIAQGVVKDYLEPEFEKIFHSSSFGYRPGRSAHDALKQCRRNCYNNAVIANAYAREVDASICRKVVKSRSRARGWEHRSQTKRYTTRWCHLSATGEHLFTSLL